MVRAGVVSHPSEWTFGGYNEIQEPRRKCVLINYQRLAQLAGFSTYDAFQKVHKDLVSESLANDDNSRHTKWTESIAVGSKNFIETIKEQLGLRAGGRKILETNDSFQLREDVAGYIANSDAKNGDIGPENGYIWDDNPAIAGS